MNSLYYIFFPFQIRPLMAEEFDHDSGRSSPIASLTLALAKEMVENKDGGDFDDVMQYVKGAMSVLQKNYNEDELVNSLRMIQSCIKKENGELIQSKYIL